MTVKTRLLIIEDEEPIRVGLEDVFVYHDLLYANQERPVSREELLHRVWGYTRDLRLETRTVDVHIAQLRRRLESEPTKPRHLVTVRDAGYRLMVE